MRAYACRYLCRATKECAFLTAIVSIERVYGVVLSELTESFLPLVRGAEDGEIKVQFGYAKYISLGFLKGILDLLVLMALGINWQALDILKDKAEGLGGFG
jgi:hypothetical protein